MPSDQERRERLAEAGAWLREQRIRRGFDKAADFARKLGIERYTLSTYETGRSAVPDDRATQIAEVLGMDEIEVRRGLGLWVPDDEPRRTHDDAVSYLAYDATLEEVEEMARTLLARLEQLRRDAG